jgi:putative ABC transport system permease protein
MYCYLENDNLGLAGIAIGALASLALGRYISGLLYGVQPTDALTLAAAATLLILATLLATYLPARRAAKLDPMLALRHQ